MKPNPLVDEQYLAGVSVEGLIQKLIAAGRTAERMEREADWRIAHGFLTNRPWMVRNRQTGKVLELPQERRSSIVMQNLITPRVETLIGIDAYTPRWVGRNTAQRGTEDQLRARAVGDLANHVGRVVAMALRKTTADYLKHAYGLCFFHLGWDDSRGPLLPNFQAEPCPECGGASFIQDQMGNAVPCPTCAAQGAVQGPPVEPGFVNVPVDTSPAGDFVLDVLPPYQVVPDPVDDPFNPQRILVERVMGREAAADRFLRGTPYTVDDLEQVGNGQMTGTLWNGNVGAESLNRGAADVVVVRQFWQRFPDGSPHKDGIYAVQIGNLLVAAGRFPENIKRIPVVPYRGFVRDGFYYPESTTDRLIPIQFEHNDLNFQIRQHVEMGVAMRIMVPKGVGFELTDEPGVTLYDYKQGKPKPEFLKDPGVGVDPFTYLAQLERMADEVSYAVPAMRGQTAGSQDTATFADIRQERAMVPLRRVQVDNELSMTEVGRMFVDCARVRYSDGRMFRDVYGSGGKPSVRAMRLDQIGSSDDCELIPEKDLGRTRAARNQEIFEAAKSGATQDPILMKMLKLGNIDVSSEEYEADETFAEDENTRFREWQPDPQPQQIDPATGQPMPLQTPVGPPQQYENDDVHLRVHKGLANELRMALGDADLRVVGVLEHIALHEQNKQFKAQQAAQAQQVAAVGFGRANGADAAAQPVEAQDTAVVPPEPGPAQRPPLPEPGQGA